MKRTLILMIVALGVFACSAPAAVNPGSGVETASATPRATIAADVAKPAATEAAAAAAAVDASIAAISLSEPPADAARAFELCLVNEWVAASGSDVIAGLGHIEHATDAIHYARLTGRDPELKSGSGAWMVQYKGDIRMPRSNTIYIDPTCIVVDGGDGGFFGTGGVRQVGSDAVRQPPEDSSTPDRALPAPKP
jgi:hypothetical protein